MYMMSIPEDVLVNRMIKAVRLLEAQDDALNAVSVLEGVRALETLYGEMRLADWLHFTAYHPEANNWFP